MFVRDNAAPSASVILKLQPAARSLERRAGPLDRQSRRLVGAGHEARCASRSSTRWARCSASPAAPIGLGAAGDERIAFQRRVEDKYRAQLIQLLTPLVGAGNFTAEVQADVDLDETQATRESYDKEGALRAEQGNWTGTQQARQPARPAAFPARCPTRRRPPAR